jgi:hypothetical protein
MDARKADLPPHEQKRSRGEVLENIHIQKQDTLARAPLRPPKMYQCTFKTVQIEIGLSEYGGNKKAVRTDGLLAKHQN